MLIGIAGSLQFRSTGEHVGTSGTGKDTVARIVQETLGAENVLVISFADEVKRIAVKLWGFSPQVLWGPTEERQQFDPKGRVRARDALRAIGTAARYMDQDVWVNVVDRNVRAVLRGDASYTREEGLRPIHRRGMSAVPQHVVVPDVRLDNEALWVKNFHEFDVPHACYPGWSELWLKTRFLHGPEPSVHDRKHATEGMLTVRPCRVIQDHVMLEDLECQVRGALACAELLPMAATIEPCRS